MDAFQHNSVLELMGIHRVISHELDKQSQNREYEPCITKERVLINYIVIRASAAIHYVIRITNEKAQQIRNEIVQPLQGLKLHGFISRCVSEAKKPLCTEQEAAKVLVQARNAFQESLSRLTKVGNELLQLQQIPKNGLQLKLRNYFLKDAIKRCVEV